MSAAKNIKSKIASSHAPIQDVIFSTVQKKSTRIEPSIDEASETIISNNGTKLINEHNSYKIINPIERKNYQPSLPSENKKDQILLKKITKNQSIYQVQKVLRHEQELQKQLYSGANIVNNWRRVNHNNKILYISPSGILLSSLEQVKDYLLSQNTCKCGLPFPLRVELFFNFNIEVPTIPLKAQIGEIKFDPSCEHRKIIPSKNVQIQKQKIDGYPLEQNQHKKLQKNGEFLLPSYLSAISESINQKFIKDANQKLLIEKNEKFNQKSRIGVILKSGNQISSNVTQKNLEQKKFVDINSKNLQNMKTNDVSISIIKEKIEGEKSTVSKLPPWKKNSFQNQRNIQQPLMTSTSNSDSTIPIFQYTGQTIAIDQRNQHFSNQTQQIRIMEYKTIDNNKTIITRQPTFKENPTAYLNQQTELLNSTISTLHSPNQINMTNLKINEKSSESKQHVHFKQSTSFTGQNNSDGQSYKTKESAKSDTINTIGPCYNQKRNDFLVQHVQESQLKNTQHRNLLKLTQEESSVTSTSNIIKYSISEQSDITSSSELLHKPEDLTKSEEVVDSKLYSGENTNVLNTSQIRNMQTQMRNTIGNDNNSLFTQRINNASDQVMMTSNGHQFILMPSNNMQSTPQTIMQIHPNSNSYQRVLQNAGGFALNNQSIVFQNEPITQNNLTTVPKSNILIPGGSTIPVKTTIIAGNQPLGQQTIIVQNNIGQQTNINDPRMVQNIYLENQIQQNKITVKRGRKRKNPTNETPVVIQKQIMANNSSAVHHKQQLSHIQLPNAQEGFSNSNGNIFINKNKDQSSLKQQVFMQNGQTIYHQPIEFHRNTQTIPASLNPPLVRFSSDGNSLIQLQNSPYQVLLTPSIRSAISQEQPLQAVQKIILGNNGQQYFVQCGGQLNVLNSFPMNPMGLVVQQQDPTLVQNNQQQIMSPIIIQSPTPVQQITNNSQIVTANSSQILPQGMLSTQKAHVLHQNNILQQDNLMIPPKTAQKNKSAFYPRIIQVPRATAVYTTTSKNVAIPAYIHNDNFLNEYEEVNYEFDDQEEEGDDIYYQEADSEELNYSFGDDDKPDMVEELHHGTSQKILHSNSMIEGHMNIDDITIEMDEINDLNDYLDAIDEEDNKTSQIGLSSMKHFDHFHPDTTTTHSPQSSCESVNNLTGCNESNESAENNDTVTSTLEIDSSLISLDAHNLID